MQDGREPGRRWRAKGVPRPRVCLNFVALPVGGKAPCVFRFSRAAHQQRNFRTAKAEPYPRPSSSVELALCARLVGGPGLRVQTQPLGSGTGFKQAAQMALQGGNTLKNIIKVIFAKGRH